MKFMKAFQPLLAAILLSLAAFPAAAADEQGNLLERFDREFLVVMSGFASARAAGVSSAFRQNFLSSLDQFSTDAAALQGIISELGIGEDLNLATHARTIRESFQVQSQGQTKPIEVKDNKKKSNTSKANDPFSRMMGTSLGEYAAGLGTGTSTPFQAGFAFHMTGNAIQTLSSLGLAVRNGKYSVAPQYRKILPYLEFKRCVEYYNASYENFDTLTRNPLWQSDFERRLRRMSRLAAIVQPVYIAVFPGKAVTITAENDRLASVYRRYLEYVKAVEEANKTSSRLGNSGTNSAFTQIRQANIPDKGAILRDYDTAASKLAAVFADMDSIDWTTRPFSAEQPDGPAKK